MPELPDITIYRESLEARLLDRRLEAYRIDSPFLLRTVEPSLDAAIGATTVEVRRIGKRIAIGFDGGIWAVFHLMVAGRFHWSDAAGGSADMPALPKRARRLLAAFVFEPGVLALTEAGTKKRASLYIVHGEQALAALDPGGLEVLECSSDEFRDAITLRNHTLKRALTDPRILSGIGNAYSDEILHRAGLSPVAMTKTLTPDDAKRLHTACRDVLNEWTVRLRRENAGRFPTEVTAFRDSMAVHGKFGQPCPACSTAVQRIRYASRETNYCPRCQTGGRVLADRSLSRLLKRDWPKTIEELERRGSN